MKALTEQHDQRAVESSCGCRSTRAGGQDGAYGSDGTTRVTNWVKQLDPTRLVNNASGWTDSGAGDVHDIHNYPGPAAPPVEKQRAIVLGEFGGLGLPISGHMWQTDKNWGYQNMASKGEADGQVRAFARPTLATAR
jgi:hypothetical protein